MDINGINHISAARNISATHNVDVTKKSVQADVSRPIRDEIEISTTAERLSSVDSARQANSSSEVRYDLVNRIREEIAAGTYDTPERMDIAMERLLSRLG